VDFPVYIEPDDACTMNDTLEHSAVEALCHFLPVVYILFDEGK